MALVMNLIEMERCLLQLINSGVVSVEEMTLHSVVEMFDDSVAPGLSLRDEYRSNFQGETQSNYFADSARNFHTSPKGEFIIHLQEIRDANSFPESNQLMTGRDGCLILEDACLYPVCITIYEGEEIVASFT